MRKRRHLVMYIDHNHTYMSNLYEIYFRNSYYIDIKYDMMAANPARVALTKALLNG